MNTGRDMTDHSQFIVTVVGLGKIGLPLAAQFASMGIRVIGVDISLSLVDAINAGVSPIEEPGLSEKLSSSVDAGLLFGTTDIASAVSESNYIVVVVPLYVDGLGIPDFSNFDGVVAQIGRSLKPGATVIIETTLPVGTTRSRFLPILEKASKLSCGSGFFLAFSPERVSSGTVFRDFSLYPKLVGGVDSNSSKMASLLYRAGFVFDKRGDLERPNGVWELSTAESAEFAKLAETTYRDVNIALANTFNEHARDLGLTFSEIRDASNSQPFSHVHSPGISVGGHCIPVYPHFYLQSHPAADLVKLARETNVTTTRRAVDRGLRAVSSSMENLKVLVSGLSYRTNVKEHAFSGAKQIAERLEELAVPFTLTDELYSDEEIMSLGYPTGSLDGYGLLIINSGSRKYQLQLLSKLSPSAVILDGRGILEADDWPRIIN